MASGERLRADQALVERGQARSRSLARRLIDDGAVSIRVGSLVERLDRPSRLIGADELLEVGASNESRYVSRAGAKLDDALATIGLDCREQIVLDLGMSTGGFADCLLGRGARAVVGIEVGHDQLAPALANDPRVHCFERTHVGTIDAPAWLAQHGLAPFSLIVSDLSFISSLQLLGQIARFAEPGANLLLLVKPQFELGPQAARKGGIVADEAGEKLEALARERAAAAGWAPLNWHRCRLRGTDGNQEYFLHARRRPGPVSATSGASGPDQSPGSAAQITRPDGQRDLESDSLETDR